MGTYAFSMDGAETPDALYKSVIHALRHETDVTKLCGQLYNLTTLYYDETNWPQLEKYEAEYMEAVNNCKALEAEPERTPTIQPGEKVDLSCLKPVHQMAAGDSGRCDKHVMV